uniref:Putative secreted protein n=1 Tax=Panstrongylus lignarius TaxID=156445 RepID=A0A224XUU4_9HEMI
MQTLLVIGALVIYTGQCITALHVLRVQLHNFLVIFGRFNQITTCQEVITGFPQLNTFNIPVRYCLLRY